MSEPTTPDQTPVDKPTTAAVIPEPEPSTPDPSTDQGTSEPQFVGGLRDLIAKRKTTKMRRIHKQWFCLDPEVQSELDQITAQFVEELSVHQALQGETKRPGKYAPPLRLQNLAQRRDELAEQARATGVMGVFANLNDTQLTAVSAQHADDEDADARGFARAKATLMAAFLRWETADGQPIDGLGRDDLDNLLQPEVLEQGEWLPLAAQIFKESQVAITRPTLLTL